MELEGSLLPPNILPHQPQHLPLNRQFGICPTIPSSLVLFPQALLLYFLKARCCICFAGCFVPLQQSSFLFNLFLVFSRYEHTACFFHSRRKDSPIQKLISLDYSQPNNAVQLDFKLQHLTRRNLSVSDITDPKSFRSVYVRDEIFSILLKPSKSYS